MSRLPDNKKILKTRKTRVEKSSDGSSDERAQESCPSSFASSLPNKNNRGQEGVGKVSPEDLSPIAASQSYEVASEGQLVFKNRSARDCREEIAYYSKKRELFSKSTDPATAKLEDGEPAVWWQYDESKEATLFSASFSSSAERNPSSVDELPFAASRGAQERSAKWNLEKNKAVSTESDDGEEKTAKQKSRTQGLGRAEVSRKKAASGDDAEFDDTQKQVLEQRADTWVDTAFFLPSVEELEKEFFNYTAQHVPRPHPLHHHSEEFEKGIIQVVPDIYVAIGYGLANSVILNGTDGLVVVDTMESTATMQAVWSDWLKFPYSNRPVKAIIYTHFHTDHIFGASAIAAPNVTEVHAYWLTFAEMSKVFTLTAGTTYRRSMRQFGVFVDSEDFVNAGIGPTLHYNNTAEIGAVLPTHIMYEEQKTLNIAGMKLQLLHAPGESKDQIVVWIEDKRVLLGADNLYRSLPNIYAIRGTETRDCNDWIASLDLMRSLDAEYLVLGHTRPLVGKEHIQSTLIAYRDAIQFIHDQTVRFMNKGFFVNDIAHQVKLPEHLANHPFLQPFYGTVPWAVRAIFTHYMGWYSGQPEDLAVMTTQEKAEALLSLAGSVDDLLFHAIENLRQGRVNWALEFASAAYTVEPRSKRAKTLKILALRANAAHQTAATGRNWFLTAALELEGRAELKLSDFQKRQTLAKISLQQQFELLPVRLIPERARDLTCILKFHFSDVNENVCVHFRRGIAYLRWPCENTPDVEVESTRDVWLSIVNKDRSPVVAFATGDLKVKGPILTLVRALLAVELDAD
ncbi:metallo-beta-lactamase domain-containing protein [Toxoplasma gondii MAS]|uniref:Metallo-beta-lactamase domain-containing protein n=2 Tax=Toxoplasma gondii TaxID=5811 RepID=A0A086Q921_TOXGO|nr:metallo-beta-lactamase domain-containing protein [Toxoplasma gondii MAS]PUA89380.1 metallo-beta-lactamase domain-containing protein [Toxoplasma gondii TgCATBr9]